VASTATSVAPTETATDVESTARVETPTAVKTASKYSEASSAGHSRCGMETEHVEQKSKNMAAHSSTTSIDAAIFALLLGTAILSFRRSTRSAGPTFLSPRACSPNCCSVPTKDS